MAKGGRYLNTNKKEKKKGKGLKIFLIVLLILALLIAGGVYFANDFLDSMLDKVTFAEVEEKNNDKSFDDLMAELYGEQVPAEETSAQEQNTPTAEPTETTQNA